jgi:peptide/nickel transport system substrate-binding protein
MTVKLMILLGIILILTVACGTAEAPPEPTAAPAADATSAPVAGETSQPTPTPQVAIPPAEVQVNPGKVTVMIGDLGNERFDVPLMGALPGTINYARIAGGFLISDNEKREMVPGIASEWNLSEDGLTWDFAIRKGVKFHDGSDLTAEDVLWTFQHTFGPQAREYTQDNNVIKVSGAMHRIELSGPDKVSVTTKMPIIEFGDLISEAGSHSYPIMPKRSEIRNTEEELAYDNNPIGAGPMRLIDHTPSQVMEFERFNDFYYQPENGFQEDKRVNFQLLDLFLVPEEATRVAALRSGEADIVPASLPTREQVEAGGGRLVFASEGIYLWVMLVGCYETQHPCHDKRVRQALDYAINKELIRDQLYGGPEVFQVKGWATVTPSTIGYTPELDPRPFDPEKARQLLEDAGYPNGQGFGKLIVNTWPSTAIPYQVEAVQLAADLWKRELGLDVEVRVGDSVGITEKHRAGELNGQIYWRDNDARVDATSVIVSRYGDPDHALRYHENPELLRLTQETFQIVDPNKRAEAAKTLYPRLWEESYELGIGYLNIPWGVGPRIATWDPYPLAQFPSALHTITLK